MNETQEPKNELDLTTEPMSEMDTSVPAPLTVAYNADQERERMRGWIALVLVGLLATVFLCSFIALMTERVSMSDLKELLTIIMGPLVALVGAATGFYFGGRK